MSLPLTRRIARAALLVAAGAAPVVGAAGSASAAQLPVDAPKLGGLTALDGGTVESAVPGAKSTVAPVVGHTHGVLGHTVGSAKGLPAADLPEADLPTADLPAAELPGAELPTAGLPLG
ncbi:ATP-binding protein [Streptomyces himalayensis]|uniref:ATP-binding protein n=2 Tax=Streptomyces himalayensis TaxID=2820085 RepID=A0A7W2D767_9ACTN|nr:ATP-binding protein [Streptomyces himalayensis]MBA2944350.1 ATP-binding protein [Streptomyces himalayensis subsp. himalayensis]MBA4865720.1 ATP-binding protein [Streptomyces himalayensis subsp. aureolus]